MLTHPGKCTRVELILLKSTGTKFHWNLPKGKYTKKNPAVTLMWSSMLQVMEQVFLYNLPLTVKYNPYGLNYTFQEQPVKYEKHFHESWLPNKHINKTHKETKNKID